MERPHQSYDGREMEGRGEKRDNWRGVEEDLQDHGQVREKRDHWRRVKEDLQDHGKVGEKRDHWRGVEKDLQDH